MKLSDQAERLIDRFNLADEVDAFVREQARNRANKPRTFNFRGSKRPCKNTAPHPPHGWDSYSTVRYGRLVKYCPGVTGDGVEVVVERDVSGSPEAPSIFEGYSIVTEAETHEDEV